MICRGFGVPRSAALFLPIAGLTVASCGSEESVATTHVRARSDVIKPSRRQSPVYLPFDERADAAKRRVARVLPAASVDHGYDGEDQIDAWRVVYRVSLLLGGASPHAPPAPAAELYVDLSRDRLRARFVGAGWPGVEGAEVRMRADQSGAYVFDRRGGRPLGPGQLGSWFMGGRLRKPPTYRVWSTRANSRVPGILLCRFIAEWVQTTPEGVERRCEHGGAPPKFRVGLWRAERTAEVSVSLPRSGLRADHRRGPKSVSDVRSGTFYSRDVIGRLTGKPVGEEPLTLTNRTGARLVVMLERTPLGWVDDAERLVVSGLPHGHHRVAGLRAFGQRFSWARRVVVPGSVIAE